MATTMSQKAQQRPESVLGIDSKPVSTSGLPPGAADVLRYAAVAHRSQYRKAVLGQLSSKQAIAVQCRQCMGWTQEPCDNGSCPLWMVSPWGKRRKGVVKGQDDHQDEPEAPYSPRMGPRTQSWVPPSTPRGQNRPRRP